MLSLYYSLWGSRDVGKIYSGQVVEFNAAVKRHRVAFDDGDERWFRMERKIFSTEVNGKKVTYRGEMKVRRDAAVAGAGLAGARSLGEGLAASLKGKEPAAAEAPASKAKPKPKKAKKIDKSILNRAYMTGTLKTTGNTSVIAGWWDESKKVVQDSAKRDPQKTFQLTKATAATPIPPHEEKAEDKAEAEGGSDSEEEDYFSGGNCVGWFKAMTASGDSSYDEFEDDLMLHLKLETDESDAEGGGEEYAVRGMGCNSGGTYRVSGSAVAGGAVALLREYISEAYFEEEKGKFNKFVSGDDRDESAVEFTLGDKRFLVSEVRACLYSRGGYESSRLTLGRLARFRTSR
jgi:hypothetical protein